MFWFKKVMSVDSFAFSIYETIFNDHISYGCTNQDKQVVKYVTLKILSRKNALLLDERVLD